jgi:hypothetical protein
LLKFNKSYLIGLGCVLLVKINLQLLETYEKDLNMKNNFSFVITIVWVSFFSHNSLAQPSINRADQNFKDGACFSALSLHANTSNAGQAIPELLKKYKAQYANFRKQSDPIFDKCEAIGRTRGNQAVDQCLSSNMPKSMNSYAMGNAVVLQEIKSGKITAGNAVIAYCNH